MHMCMCMSHVSRALLEEEPASGACSGGSRDCCAQSTVHSTAHVLCRCTVTRLYPVRAGVPGPAVAVVVLAVAPAVHAHQWSVRPCLRGQLASPGALPPGLRSAKCRRARSGSSRAALTAGGLGSWLSRCLRNSEEVRLSYG